MESWVGGHTLSDKEKYLTVSSFAEHGLAMNETETSWKNTVITLFFYNTFRLLVALKSFIAEKVKPS